MHERIAETAGAWFDRASLERDLDRLVAAGFDTLLISDADDLAMPLAEVVARTTERRLATWIAISPDATGRPRFDAHAAPRVAAWLFDGEAALDPRRAPRSVRLGPVVDAAPLIDAWCTKLAVAARAGVRGFVFRDPDRLPATFWSALKPDDVAGRPIRWIAWTAGLAPDVVASLVASGFDTVVSSVAWWNGRARWIVEEHAQVAAAARLAFADDPFADDPSATDPRATGDEALSSTQRLRIAALLGDALLVPERAWRDGDARTVAEWHTVQGWFKAQPADRPRWHPRFASGEDAPVTALLLTPHPDLRASDTATVALINPGDRTATIDAAIVSTMLSGFSELHEVLLLDDPTDAPPIDPCCTIELGADKTRIFAARRLPMIRLPRRNPGRSADDAVALPRIAISEITPSVDHGRFPVKRTAGESVQVEADIVIDGHEQLAAALLYRAAGDRVWREVPMKPLGNDRLGGRFPLLRVGRHEYTIEAWRDAFATYRHELDKKAAAGLDVSLELIEGRQLVDAALAHSKTQKRLDVTKRLVALSQALHANPATADKTPASKPPDRAAMANAVAALLASQTRADMLSADRREFATRPEVVFAVDAERSAASFASWYELFPRSLGNPPGVEATHHGTFDDVIERLPAIKAMGFDVLYFPPIHPIGERNRKGRNNSLVAQEDDPGSPYAIGSQDGGHEALHPQLGTFEDFQRMRAAALDQGLELALDFAIQCSPDHPWLKQHPGWFAWRPDGSLRYAENPPKKYEDIVNVDFYGDQDAKRARRGDTAPALWSALRDVILSWVEQGVRIFRVDNPHTKPLPFWEWMIGEVRGKHPDTIFLSEAFTRPKVMYQLAKIGFSQSYTYFTWRETKQELIDYLGELTGPRSSESPTSSPRDFFRPHFFVNTPDINPVFLQRSGRAGFLIRAALAAMLSGLWGVYSGFELCEATPVPGKEDYLDSEKYQLRAWDWQRPGNIIAEITALNRIRNENPALRTHLDVRFENVFDPNILYFAKQTADLSNIVLIAINLDPHGVHEADFEVPLWRWDRPDDATVQVTDLLDGHRFAWHGKYQRMRLDPGINPYAIWRVSL